MRILEIVVRRFNCTLPVQGEKAFLQEIFTYML